MSESDGDESVTVAPLEKAVFLTWSEFHEYLAEYQQRTHQIYSVRTATSAATRNMRITERFSRRGEAVPPGEFLPEEIGAYSKRLVCTRHGRPRPSKSAGLRATQSRAINCPAQITLVLKKELPSGKYFVRVSSHTTRHNHSLSDGQYRRHPMIRKITDPTVLRTMHTLQEAEVEPAKILKYVREHTDKEVVLRDVHNLLASIRRKPPLSSEAVAAPPAATAATPSIEAAPPSACAATPFTEAFDAPPAATPATPSIEAAPPTASAATPFTEVVAAPPAATAPTSFTEVVAAPTVPTSFTIRSAARRPSTVPREPQPHFSEEAPRPPPLPAAPARQEPTQYGKFLATFNVCKEIAELMAEMDSNRFARCYAELGNFLRIAESGRVPIVTTREAVQQMQNNVLTGIPSTPMPQPEQVFRPGGPNTASEHKSTASSFLN